jgi:hypothetical protein
MSNALYDSVYKTITQRQWTEKDALAVDTFNMVNWKAVGKAMAGSTLSQQVFLTKHVSGMCGVEKIMRRWTKTRLQSTPAMHYIGGSSAHMAMLGRRYRQSVEWSSSSHLSLAEFSQNIYPDLTLTIITYLDSRRNENQHYFNYPAALQEVLQQQLAFGGCRFYEGCLVKDWEGTQQ